MLKYNLGFENERYDFVKEIGYMPNYTYEVTDEPFDISNAYLYRWDKDKQEWVEGVIDEETGEWQLKGE